MMVVPAAAGGVPGAHHHQAHSSGAMGTSALVGLKQR